MGSLSPPFGLEKNQGYNDRTQLLPEKCEFTKAGDKEICVEAKVKATHDTHNWLLCMRGYFSGGGAPAGADYNQQDTARTLAVPCV